MRIENAKTSPAAASRLPSLDLLRSFEAAARLLSFTRAGEELHLTQSAVSRQIQALEQQLGVALFKRRHRALDLTEAGREFHAAASKALAIMRGVVDGLRAQSDKRTLAVTTTHSFASLWLIQRLAGFTRDHPDVDVRISADTRVQDLERDGLDVAIRHGPASLAGPNAIRLFGERVFPVCSPTLLKKAPLRVPADLRRHVLLQYDDPDGRHPWLHWKPWLEVEGLADLRPAGRLLFSGYEQIIPAAVAGHGVALGRTPLVRDLLAKGTLVAPFGHSGDSARASPAAARAYFAIVAPRAAGRSEVEAFVTWLRAEAAREDAKPST